MYTAPSNGGFVLLHHSSLKVSVLIDGGFLRVQASRAKHKYNPDLIEQFTHACVLKDEALFRVLYYDCAPYHGELKLPVSGAKQLHAGSDVAKQLHAGSDGWLQELSRRDLFAVRRGILKFRGFKPRKIPIQPTGRALTDADFIPDVEQQGVDMRIGLDIATYSANHAIDRIVLVSKDTDCVPALKHARIAGLQTAIVELPGLRIAPELLAHVDYRRAVSWP